MKPAMLAAVDFSEVSDLVVAEAGRLARAFEGHAWLVHVAEPHPTSLAGGDVGPVDLRDPVARELRSAHRRIQAHGAALQASGVAATALLVAGTPADKILELAGRLSAHHVVLGSHGHGALHHLLMGSVSERVLRGAPCPVVFVPRRAD